MGIKRILVPYDGSKHAAAAAHYAFDVAREHGAEIEGLGLVDVGPIERVERGAAVGASAYAREARVSMLARAQGHAAEFQQTFVALCRKDGIPYEYRFEVADPIERIAERSFYADLVVMGIRTDFDPETESDSFEKLRQAMAATPRPFLGVPFHERTVSRTLVAVDFGRTCSQLLFGLAQADPYPKAKLTLLHVGGDAAADRPRLVDAADYLELFGREVEIRTEKGKPQDVVPRIVEQDDFDMAVIGGNSGGRIAQFFFGSVTRTLLGHATCPVLTIG